MGLVYRLDASDLTTLWTDAGKTTQATDGAAVQVWSPKSGSSVTTDATQSTLANRPIYRANYASSGRPGLEFDGANDLMTVAHSTGWNSTTVVEAMAALYSDTSVGGGFRYIFGKSSSGSWADTFHLILGSPSSFSAGSPSYSQLMIPETFGQWVLLYFRAGSSGPVGVRTMAANQSRVLFRNVLGGNTTPTTNTASVSIGGNSGFFFDGAIGELRLYTGGETQVTIESAIDDMATRWNIPTSFVGSGGGGLLLPRAQNGGYSA